MSLYRLKKIFGPVINPSKERMRLYLLMMKFSGVFLCIVLILGIIESESLFLTSLVCYVYGLWRRQNSTDKKDL
jgi:hypothetical protein